MKEVLTEIGIDTSIFIAGLVGAIAGTKGSDKPLITRLSSIIMGIGVSVYTTPLACDFLNILNEKSKLGIAVAIGYMGIQGVEKLIISKFNNNGTN